MSVSLVSFDLRTLDGDAGIAAIDAALTSVGAGGLDGIAPITTRFEEQLLASMAAYREIAGDRSSGAVAEVWLPVEFEGVLTVPDLPGTYRPEVSVASSFEVLRHQESIAEEVGFPLGSIPASSPDEYVLTGWHASLVSSEDQDAPIWQRDPDVAFYVALFWSAARFSIDHAIAIAYA